MPSPGMLFMDGKLGERAGGESSSELATVLMASWYNGVELGIANLDIRDIMMDSGFWDRVGSGGMVYGVLEGRLPGRFTGAGWLAVGGGGPPDSTLPSKAGEAMVRGALWFGGIPGLWRGGFGEEVHPGDGAGSDGDLR